MTWDSRRYGDWLSLLSRIPLTSNSPYAVHALKGSPVFSLLNGEIWITVGLVVPRWSSFGAALVDAEAGCL